MKKTDPDPEATPTCAPVMDWHSRKVMGWALSNTMPNELAPKVPATDALS
jgi:transposase InsO family protein